MLPLVAPERMARPNNTVAPMHVARQVPPAWRGGLTAAGVEDWWGPSVAPSTRARQPCPARRAGATSANRVRGPAFSFPSLFLPQPERHCAAAAAAATPACPCSRHRPCCCPRLVPPPFPHFGSKFTGRGKRGPRLPEEEGPVGRDGRPLRSPATSSEQQHPPLTSRW